LFKKILFPTDFSKYAEKTLEFGFELKNLGAKEVVLIHVIEKDIISYVDTFAGVDIETIIEDARKIAEKKLLEEVAIIEQHGIKARYITPIPVGDPVEEIVRAAENEKVSLILIGSKGKDVLKATLLGSVSEGVIRLSHVPVIVTKFKIEKKDGEVSYEQTVRKMFGKILYAHDLSENSNDILKYVKVAALSGDKEVVLLHVVEAKSKKEIESNEKVAKEKLNAIKSELENEGISVKLIIKCGTPHKEILNTAKEENATIIMMGSTSHGKLLGSTVDAVIRRAKIPVFVYKERKL